MIKKGFQLRTTMTSLRTCDCFQQKNDEKWMESVLELLNLPSDVMKAVIMMIDLRKRTIEATATWTDCGSVEVIR